MRVLLLILCLISPPAFAEYDDIIWTDDGSDILTWEINYATEIYFEKPPYKGIKWIEETDTQIIIHMELLDDKERG